LAAVAALSIQRAEAQGTLTMATDSAFGPNSLVVDTATGLAWLNLEYTDGLSYDQVVAGMGLGGPFSGFSYATLPQVTRLFDDATPANTDYSTTSPAIRAFCELVNGANGANGASPSAQGLVGLNGPAWELYVTGSGGYFFYNVFENTGYGENYGEPIVGSWLLKAVLPNPVILNNSTNLGVRPGGFIFTVSWASNATVVVEASTNLAAQDWQPLQTNTIVATNGAFNFSDPDWTNYPARFYRIVAK
jgi:hypothetical protein